MQHGGMLRQAMAKELEEVRPVCEQFFLYAIEENTSIFFSIHRTVPALFSASRTVANDAPRGLLQRPTGWETAW
jgi:hypothetical protein